MTRKSRSIPPVRCSVDQDTLAWAKILVSRARQALTDPRAMPNYSLYDNEVQSVTTETKYEDETVIVSMGKSITISISGSDPRKSDLQVHFDILPCDGPADFLGQAACRQLTTIEEILNRASSQDQKRLDKAENALSTVFRALNAYLGAKGATKGSLAVRAGSLKKAAECSLRSADDMLPAALIQWGNDAVLPLLHIFRDANNPASTINIVQAVIYGDAKQSPISVMRDLHLIPEHLRP